MARPKLPKEEKKIKLRNMDTKFGAAETLKITLKKFKRKKEYSEGFITGYFHSYYNEYVITQSVGNVNDMKIGKDEKGKPCIGSYKIKLLPEDKTEKEKQT